MARVVDVMKEERRRDRRRDVLLSASIDGVPVQVVDVSISGVKGALEILAAPGHVFREGARTAITFEDGPEGCQSFDVEIVRVADGSGQFGARFVDLTDQQYRMLERAVLGRFNRQQ